MLTALTHPYWIIAHAVGVPIEPGVNESRNCAMCGHTPFQIAGPAKKILGVGWSDWHLMLSRDGDICEGCKRLIGGRGHEGLRHMSLAVIDGEFKRLSLADMWPVLSDPGKWARLQILSWAESHQKQHHMRAGICSPYMLRVGSDKDTIPVRRGDAIALTDALLDLRSGIEKTPLATQTEILSGQYSAGKISRMLAALGEDRFTRTEATVARYRGTPMLRLYVKHCPVLPLRNSTNTVQPEPSTPTPPEMLDRTDDLAIDLLVTLARASELRTKEPIPFWATTFKRRVVRHSHRPLTDFVSRLMDDLDIRTVGAVAPTASKYLTQLDDATQDDVMKRIRSRAAVLIALAYDRRVQNIKKTTTPTEEATS